MNPRTFFKEFESSVDRDRLVGAVYDEMVCFCREEGITIDDISNDEMEQLAEGFVERGFGFPASEETTTADTRYEK